MKQKQEDGQEVLQEHYQKQEMRTKRLAEGRREFKKKVNDRLRDLSNGAEKWKACLQVFQVFFAFFFYLIIKK